MGVRLFAITFLASTTVAMGCGFVHRSPENLDAADMEKCTKVYGAAPGTPAYAYCRQSLERERGLPTAQSQLPPLTPAAEDCTTKASGIYCTSATGGR